MRNINLDRYNVATLYTSPGMKDFLSYCADCILNGQDTLNEEHLLNHCKAFNANIVEDDEDTQMTDQIQEPQPHQRSSYDTFTLTLDIPQNTADTHLMGGNTNQLSELMI
jgi:hypothetical protein